jgi:hypothetical protein
MSGAEGTPPSPIFLVPACQGDPLDRFFNALVGFQEASETLSRLKKAARMGETAARLKQ